MNKDVWRFRGFKRVSGWPNWFGLYKYSAWLSGKYTGESVLVKFWSDTPVRTLTTLTAVPQTRNEIESVFAKHGRVAFPVSEG